MDLGDILNSLNVKYIFCEFCWLGGSTPIKSKLFQRIYKNILWMTQASQDGGPGISDAIHMSGEKRRQWQRVLWYRGGNFGVHDGSRPQEGRLVLLIHVNSGWKPQANSMSIPLRAVSQGFKPWFFDVVVVCTKGNGNVWTRLFGSS